MAFRLRLTQGGTELFDFTDMTNCYVSGDRGGWISRSWSSGDDEASDIFRVRFVGGLEAVRTSMGKISRAFEAANRYHDSRAGAPVYIEVKIEDADGWWQSELMKDCQLNSYDVDQALRTGTMDALLTIYRRNYWQGAKTQLAITNPNGTDNTAGLRVYNCNDGATADTSYLRHNYFTVDGDDIQGDLPAPIKLDLFATYPATAINVYISATNRLPGNHVEETTYGDEIPDASSSGGSYREYPVNTGVNRIVLMTTAGQHNFDGYYHILARFPTIPVQPISLMFRDFYISDSTFRTKTILMPAQVSNPLILVDTVRIRSKTRQFNLLVDLSAPTGTDTLGIDYVAFLDSENFVHLLAYGRFGSGFDGDYVWYDNSNALESHAGWQYLSEPTRVNRYIATYGPGLFLAPGKDHKFALFWDQDQGECDVSAFLTAKLYYYPRRRTL